MCGASFRLGAASGGTERKALRNIVRERPTLTAAVVTSEARNFACSHSHFFRSGASVSAAI